MSKQLPEYPECPACGGWGGDSKPDPLCPGHYKDTNCAECGGSGYEQSKPGAP